MVADKNLILDAAQVMYQDMYDGYLPRQGSPASPGRPEMIPWNVAFRPFLDDRCSPGRDLNDQFAVALVVVLDHRDHRHLRG